MHSDNVVGYVFIFPFIFSFCVFTIFPMLTSLYMSFTDYDLLGAPRWVGFDNYVHMLTSDSSGPDAIQAQPARNDAGSERSRRRARARAPAAVNARWNRTYSV